MAKQRYFFCIKLKLSYICTRKNKRGFSGSAVRALRFAEGSLVSLQPIIDSVAQLVEHIPFKDGVLGSSPSWITKQTKGIRFNSFFYVS